MWSPEIHEALRNRPSERAQVFNFLPDKNDWQSADVEIQVSKEPYAKAQGRHGCILMRELEEERVNLFKIRIDLPQGEKESPDDVYDGVQRQALAAMTVKLFNASAPESCWSEVLSCSAYELSDRDGKPIVRGEELVTGDPTRRRLSITPASGSVYSYISSDHGLVFDSCVQIGRYWTDIAITSDSGTGGKLDKGVEGLREWAQEFGEKYSAILGVDGSQLLDSMSASDVINLMHRAGLFEEQGKEASDPKNIDASQPESAVRLEFVPSSQKWVKSSVKIKVAKVMFANGRRYGCILIKDLMEHEIVRVLKKRIDQIGGGLEDEEVLDLVQRQILGATTAKLFCAQAPHSCQPYFVNCHAYQLTNRPNQPMAFVEDLISIPNYKKKALFIKPATQGRDDVRESHRFAAFQYFGYYHSERQMVFDSAFHIDGVWTEPTVQSMDESLGGATNRGQKGIFAWEFEFEDTYSKLLQVEKRQLMKMTPDELVMRMKDRGLFGDAPIKGQDHFPNPRLLKEMKEQDFIEEAGQEYMEQAAQPRGLDLSKEALEDELADCAMERCDRLIFETETNSWESEKVLVQVAKKMFAFGAKYGCIHILEPGDRVRVLKKRLDGLETTDEMYDGVKMQGLATLCARMFCAQSPPTCQPKILSCEAMILKQRPSQPALRVEDLIRGPYEKTQLSIDPNSEMRSDIRDSHRFAAFQYFVFLQAGKGMLIHTVSLVNGLWTEPVVFSSDKTLGGKMDEGCVGISAWEGKFSAKYASALGMTTDELWCLSSVELTKRMDDLGLFDNRDAPSPPKPRQPSTRPDRSAEEKELEGIKERMKTLKHQRYLEDSKKRDSERPTVSNVYRILDEEADSQYPEAYHHFQSSAPGAPFSIARVLEETVTPIRKVQNGTRGLPPSDDTYGDEMTRYESMGSGQPVKSIRQQSVSMQPFQYQPPQTNFQMHSSSDFDQNNVNSLRQTLREDARASIGPSEHAVWPSRPASGVRLERSLGEAANRSSFQTSTTVVAAPAPTVDWGTYASKSRSGRESYA